MSTATVEGGLAFWLRYVESRGGLWEKSADRALVMVPPQLQRAFDLPEELTVTEHPEVAREDGAALLTTGHPLLTAAAEDALQAADAGLLTLAEPATQRPDDGRLLDRARDRFPVDHGRIDARGPAGRVMRQVLRVGALISYSASADDRFHERAECWVDVLSRLELAGQVSDQLQRVAAAAVGASLGAVPADLGQVPSALAEAHRLLDRAAAGRCEALAAGMVREAAEAELERTRRYYAEQLASLARRQASAAADRQAMLAARMDGIRAEERRRLAEIREKYSPRHEIRPYRLHLLRVPALRLDVDVLRGARRFSLTLDWLLPAGAFAPVRCPACGADTAQWPLVVAKTHLGCAGCLPGHAAVSLTPRSPAVPAPRPESAPSHGSVPNPGSAARPRSAEAHARAAPAGPAPRDGNGVSAAKSAATDELSHRGQAGTQAARPARFAQPALPDPRALNRSGQRLAMDLWSTATQQNMRALRRMCAPGSPAEAAIRLFGPAGPSRAVGLALGDQPESLTSVTFAPGRGELACTGGCLKTGTGSYPYLLRWQVGSRQASEILPFESMLHGFLPSARWLFGPAGARMFGGLPEPDADLDPVALRLWRRVVPAHGLPLTLRCLAAWWRIGDAGALLAAHRPSELAAAIHRMVGYRSGGAGVTHDSIGGLYQVQAARTRALTPLLQTRLHLSAQQPW